VGLPGLTTEAVGTHVVEQRQAVIVDRG
jgi:hypothetical protein